MSLYALLKRPGPSGFGYGSTALDVAQQLDLSGRTVLVTGCNSGLGAETMRVLIQRGARVLGTARTQEKARQACSPFGEQAVPFACELAEPESVHACVEQIRALSTPLHAIVANAGIMALPQLKQAYGYELQFFTNHIGHFILVTELLPQLAADGRVIMLSSEAHRGAPKEGIQFDNLSGERGYSPWVAYGQSKLANLLFAKELARRLPSSQQTANAVHPGVIQTNLFRNMPRAATFAANLVAPLFMKTVPQGAATQTFAAVHPEAGRVSGEYLVDCNVGRPHRLAEDQALAAELWRLSEDIVAKL